MSQNPFHLKSILIIILSGLCFNLLSVFAQGQTAVNQTTDILGTVRAGNDSSGIPEANILIVGTTRGAVTDSIGRYRIEGVPIGNYPIRVRHVDFCDKETTVHVNDHPLQQIDFELSPDQPCCGLNDNIAKQDIASGQLHLFVQTGGIISPVYSDDDHDFEKRYSIRYRSFGCISPPAECILSYNRILMDYLDKRYGSEWREEARPDVYGLR